MLVGCSIEKDYGNHCAVSAQAWTFLLLTLSPAWQYDPRVLSARSSGPKLGLQTAWRVI
jgi:hypothetical protein